MAIIHVAAITRDSGEQDENGRSSGSYSLMGTWIDEDQETVPWENTSGWPTYHHGHIFHWGGATHTREEIYRTVFPMWPHLEGRR